MTNTEIATFGVGCFWRPQKLFHEMDGVDDTAVGFMGGDVEDPTYKQVCTGKTGHAEVVQVEYDPEAVSYKDLLEAFWEMHDPTQVNRQGPDFGSQYRSVIFYHTQEQKERAKRSKQALEESDTYDNPIATAIEPAGDFWRAEEYHQHYLDSNDTAVC